ncbi:homeobox-leucine zipper protein PROTODERMAL FACTOR 2-like [Cryptomeria japonica]|uniref:homeobox-leucine zipper protein PROTODERMAL FACTOR 2-like n=1 Tax=Cryptomeria japonica TaxID=3369 RepID=UPI0027D9DEFD|nr:homeobox-leucine zipper protein PROTODERMAL FACTOR 2-like [Cryptomeria japonica]
MKRHLRNLSPTPANALCLSSSLPFRSSRKGVFKMLQHPDEKDRQELSTKLGLTSQQIKFWFQNRRTQVKVQQERTDNTNLCTENERFRLDRQALRNTLNNIRCQTCGGSNFMTEMVYEQQSLALKNELLRTEIEKLNAVASSCVGRTIPLLETRADQSQMMYSSHHEEGSSGQNQITLPTPTCVSLDESLAMEAAQKATEEFIWMVDANEPVWVKKPLADGTIEILNTNQLYGTFPQGMGLSSNMKREGSRDTSIVSITGAELVDLFMDVMYAELQILSPLVPTRHISFLRFSQQPTNGMWIVVDFSLENLNYSISPSVGWYHKHPSGCVIQDMPNGCSKVIWIEQGETDYRIVHKIFEQVINSEMAFGAQHWLTCLQRQYCWFKTLVDLTSEGDVSRTNMIRLAQNISSQFVANISALSQSSNDPIKITTRNASEVGQSSGVIVCVGTSIKLSVPPNVLFNFLGDERTASKYKLLSCGEWKELASIGNGSDPSNCISLFDVYCEGETEKTLKHSYRDASGSFCVYTAINVDIIHGKDASSLPIAAHHGFAVLPYHTSTAVNSLIPTTILHEEASATSLDSVGSVLTLIFQNIETEFTNCSLSGAYVEKVHNTMNNTIQRIKKFLALYR